MRHHTLRRPQPRRTAVPRAPPPRRNRAGMCHTLRVAALPSNTTTHSNRRDRKRVCSRTQPEVVDFRTIRSSVFCPKPTVRA